MNLKEIISDYWLCYGCIWPPGRNPRTSAWRGIWTHPFEPIHHFYPSISEDLLKNAINFAEKRIGVSTEEKEVVFQARKSLLFNKGQAWVKKEGDTFDVTMGAYDGAEVCEIVGSYILHQIGSKYNRKVPGPF